MEKLTKIRLYAQEKEGERRKSACCFCVSLFCAFERVIKEGQKETNRRRAIIIISKRYYV